jgi:hypothetical protein
MDMDPETQHEGLEHLANIEHELEAIKQSAPSSKQAFFHGILQGAGALVGGVAGLIVLGWLLALFGIIPGLATIAHYLQDAVSQAHSRY